MKSQAFSFESQTSETSTEQRTKTVLEVLRLARSIEAGGVVPKYTTLLRLAEQCDRLRLPMEALRVRRWMGLR